MSNKFTFLTFLFILSGYLSVFSQTQFWSDTFEDSGAPSSGTRTPSTSFSCGSPATAYFMRTDNSSINLVSGPYSNYEGSKFWAGEDIDMGTSCTNNSSSAAQNVTWTGINISGKSGLSVKGFFAANPGGSFQGSQFGASQDKMEVEYRIDGGAWTKVLAFYANTVVGGTGTLYQDTNGDLLGDGTGLSYVFTEFSATISETGTTLDLRVNCFANASVTQEIAFDNIRLYESVVSLPSVTTSAISTYTSSSATMGGDVTANGGASVTERGVVYSSTDATPTIGESGVTKDANGTGTGTFSKSITGLSGNTTYYVCAYATNSAGTSYGTVVSFTTNVLTVTWNGTAWSPSAPTSLDNVIIDGTYSGVGFACHDLTINAGKQVTISSGTLAVGGNLILKSDATGTASLIGTTTVGGTTIAERYMTGNAWHLVSPIAYGQNVADFLTANTAVATSGTNRGLMDYKTSTNTWNTYYQTTGATGTMDAGKGYSARITTDGTVTFTGTLTSGNKTVSLSNVGEGWNCVGNPYPSAINMNTAANAANNFLKTNALDAANIDPSYCVYVWDDGSKTYQVLNNVPGNPRDPGVNVFAPGQGFFVKTNGAGTIQFTTAMQVHNTSAVLKSTDIPWTSVALKATSTSTSSTAQVYFHEGMTKGLDPTYDAGLLRGTNGLSLYTKLIDDNGVDFAIQCLPENGMESFVVPVGLDANAGGEVKFSATTFGLPTGSSVILEDRTAKVYTDLSNGGEYAVTLSANSSGTGRFYIHTSTLTTGTSGLLPTEGFSLKAYPANGLIWIDGQVSGSAKAYLFNIGGSKLGEFNLQEGNRNSIPASGLATGVYLLKVTDGSKQFNTKIVLN